MYNLIINILNLKTKQVHNNNPKAYTLNNYDTLVYKSTINTKNISKMTAITLIMIK